MSLPQGWRREPIADLFSIQLGKMLNKVASSAHPQYSYLGNREVQWGRFDLSNTRAMHFSEAERAKFRLRRGDLLVCEGGEVGRTALWNSDEEFYYQKAIHRLRPRSSEISPQFMQHFMQFAATAGRFADFTSQSSIAHLTREKLAQVPVDVPPLGEQRKIAAILSSVDEAIEKTQAVIDQVQVVKKGLMQELLTRGLPGRHTKFKQTEIGEIPASWEVKTLSDLAAIVRGQTPRPARDPRYFGGAHAPWITVGELPRDDYPYLFSTTTSLTEAGAERSRWLEPGTLVISNSGWGCGVPKILGLRGCANDGVAALLSLDPGVDVLFLYYSIFRLTPYLRHTVARGVEQPNLNKDLIGAVQIPLPGLVEQNQITTMLHDLDYRLIGERSYLTGLEQLKQSLMSVLLTGELRVTP